jgi:threonylcarbamoyladenosine tRNA methylthiotransferase MtaB
VTIRTFAIKSFGCKVNQYEEQVLRESLLKIGFIEQNIENADVFIINSCTVTRQADKKSLHLIKRIKRLNPAARIVFTGCLAVLKEDINMLETVPGIDMVIPNKEKSSIPFILREGTKHPIADFMRGISKFDSHTRAFVKIQNGCDQKCAYCKVCLVRGHSRSRDTASILAEIKKLLKNGYSEIVLTGICIGLWRGSGGEKLTDLLKKIISIQQNFRIRVSSIEPNHISRDLISLISSTSKICKHFHIPLQSGSNRILKSMGRKYNISDFKNVIDNIRAKIYPVGISLDVIIGFPGEKETDFIDSLKFVKDIYPSRLHVFRYSDRPGTRSYTFKDKIPGNISKERSKCMIADGLRMQEDFHNSLIGKRLEVLPERKTNNGFFEGYSSEYSRVRIKEPGIKIGKLKSFTPREFDSNSICLF